MTFVYKDYNRKRMRRVRQEQRKKKLLSEGKCPVCEMLLISKYHINCKYLDNMHGLLDSHVE